MVNGLPEKLQKQRKLARLSQKSVAERLGVSPSIISAYESGERTPSTENLLALAYLYKCSTDYLLGKTAEAPAVYIEAANLTEQQIRLLTEFVQTIKN